MEAQYHILWGSDSDFLGSDSDFVIDLSSANHGVDKSAIKWILEFSESSAVLMTSLFHFVLFMNYNHFSMPVIM